MPNDVHLVAGDFTAVDPWCLAAADKWLSHGEHDTATTQMPTRRDRAFIAALPEVVMTSRRV